VIGSAKSRACYVIAASLVGLKMPDLDLASTSGDLVNPAQITGWAVYFIYPYTGRPGFSDPPNWDFIKGAHGSTPQALAFSEAYADFEKLNVKVFGLSLCAPEWQSEFVTRNKLRVELLSDDQSLFSKALALPHFMAGQKKFLQRTTLIVRDAKIGHAYYPDPQADAGFCLDWLRAYS
jgi:peroxiredoxin